MSIQVTMTETEVQEVARKIGIELTREVASQVLRDAEAKLNEDHRRGAPRFFQEAIFRVLRKEP